MLGGYLAALRELNRGRSNVITEEDGVHPFGAYGILLENWKKWSAEAGFSGAHPADPMAQDAVAGYWATKMFKRYGSWDAVSGAWIAGQDEMDRIYAEGRTSFKNQRILAFQQAMKEAMDRHADAEVPLSAKRWENQTYSGGWLSPIAGQYEYSGGSWMPDKENHRGRTHPAIDVYAEKGTPIVAPIAGKVMRAGWNEHGGNTVTILGDDGITYYFAHMDQPAVAKQGQRVVQGDHVGFVGNSGSAKTTSPHLHMSMKEGGSYVNPKSYLDGAREVKGRFRAEGTHRVGGAGALGANLDGMLQRVSTAMVPEGQERKDPRLIGTAEYDQGVQAQEPI